MRHFKQRTLSIGMLTVFILGCSFQNTWATSEVDPSPGPPILSQERMMQPSGEAPATKENTVTYPFPEGEDLSRGGPFVPAMGQPTGALTGKVIYTSGGHGFAATASGGWTTGRGNNNSVSEDMGNKDQMSIYADYCFNAGATVVPFRPVGNQTNEVIVDDSSPSGFQLFGTWTNSANTPYWETIPMRYTTVGLPLPPQKPPVPVLPNHSSTRLLPDLHLGQAG